MKREKVKLGGMALQNGVLVHGPRAGAAAVRLPDGRLEVAAARKRLRAADVERPFLRGPAKLLEALAILPEVRRRLPAAKLAFERPAVLAAMLGSAVVVRVVRGSGRIGPAAKEHERCGSHLVGPLIATSTLASALAARAPAALRGPARIGASFGALAATTELFGWMVRNPDRPLARALARPGHELQHRLATAEPTPEQLEVAEAALRACLALEDRDPQALLPRLGRAQDPRPLRRRPDLAVRDGDDDRG